MTDTTCPACGRSFRSLKGRSGHLATFNDGTHASYRQTHGMKAPLGPDHKPTKAGARVRSTHAHPTTPTAPARTPTAPMTPSPTDAAADLRRTLQELTEKSLEANRARGATRVAPAPQPTPSLPALQAPAPPPAARPGPPEQPSAPTNASTPDPTKPGEGWLIGAGAVAAGIGLASLVAQLKGANAPKAEAPPSEAPPTRPGMEIPSSIWATSEGPPETTENPWLDSQLGYGGKMKRRRGWLK